MTECPEYIRGVYIVPGKALNQGEMQDKLVGLSLYDVANNALIDVCVSDTRAYLSDIY